MRSQGPRGALTAGVVGDQVNSSLQDLIQEQNLDAFPLIQVWKKGEKVDELVAILECAFFRRLDVLFPKHSHD